ncbi:MAG: hypothetical protein WA993_19305 [Candidatus Binatus sp.]|jgi:hypothetical protein|uniref:hypothetical protein n=1 Tax=Candidatus Binatus sp. TaxID=2811406 RepID=UPI003C9999B1
MATSKVVELAVLIREKTRSGEVRWEKTSNARAFQTAFPKYAVQIVSPAAGMATLLVFNAQGALIEELSWPAAVGAQLGPALIDTFEMARRQALGVDNALDEILGDLKTRQGKK